MILSQRHFAFNCCHLQPCRRFSVNGTSCRRSPQLAVKGRSSSLTCHKLLTRHSSNSTQRLTHIFPASCIAASTFLTPDDRSTGTKVSHVQRFRQFHESCYSERFNLPIEASLDQLITEVDLLTLQERVPVDDYYVDTG
jgi:hypothetical protein